MRHAFRFAFRLVGCASALTVSASVVWAQSSTATGTYLGQKVNPVLAVELDAAPVRALPQTAPAASGMVGGSQRSEPPAGASVPMYTGQENSQSMGNASPLRPDERDRRSGR